MYNRLLSAPFPLLLTQSFSFLSRAAGQALLQRQFHRMANAGLDIAPVERRRRELPDHRQEYLALRERWATLTNEALREANVEARVDHRSLAAQGIDREPLPRIPLMQLKMEQRGLRSALAERLRAEYRERVQRRLDRSADPAPAQRGAEAGGARSRSEVLAQGSQ